MRSSQDVGQATVAHAEPDPPATSPPDQPEGVLVPLSPTGTVAASRAEAPLALTGGAYDIPLTLGERIALCRFLAGGSLLPKALINQPANILLIMHKALALAIPLAVALEHMHVIDGKVGHSAELLRALAHRHGHLLRWITITDKEVCGELILRHDPHPPRRECFTIAQAATMKLTGKDNWQKDPTSMLVARCTTRLVSRHCPEIALALGNLSAIDMDDEPDVPPDQPAGTGGGGVDDQVARAEEILRAAWTLEDTDDLKTLGQRAKREGLLEVAVEEGGTLQQALLRRMQEISDARAAAREQPDPDADPQR